MKKFLALMLTAVFLVSFAACTSDAQEDITLSAFSVDINPSILFVIDEDEIIVSFVLNNEDAEIVAAELDFVGLTAEEALALFIDAAIEAGYIDVDAENNAIFITTEDDDDLDENDEGMPEFAKRLRERAEAEFRAHGIGAAVIIGTLDEALLELAEQYDIGIGRLRILQTAVEIDGELTYEEALEMDMKDIMTIIHGSHEARMATFRAAKQEEAKAVREEMKENVRERLEAHRALLEENGVDIPDYSAIREAFREQAEAHRAAYEERIEERRQQAQDRRP